MLHRADGYCCRIASTKHTFQWCKAWKNMGWRAETMTVLRTTNLNRDLYRNWTYLPRICWPCTKRVYWPYTEGNSSSDLASGKRRTVINCLCSQHCALQCSLSDWDFIIHFTFLKMNIHYRIHKSLSLNHSRPVFISTSHPFTIQCNDTFPSMTSFKRGPVPYDF